MEKEQLVITSKEIKASLKASFPVIVTALYMFLIQVVF